ncbi:hypothetical protein [Flavobacterium cerinum]|uniref:Phage tail collar domain-containing protein n=1 Tax=Flavobacterium cerinum TaxID=2502784 RepID=A0A3S3QMK1_9FLAO|nr:hypothetical protein [Flavobacterium cerinum]RWX03352.1 hypothetical protein EPI11_00035 [Flavobacterium cerinum]
MNKSNFNQTGGLPLTTERLDEMQTAWNVLNSLGNIIGTRAIISGCNLLFGNNVTDGFVFINGEVMPFKGGLSMTTVIIVEETITDEFENGEVKAVHKIRYATFGTGSPSYLWSSFKRGKATNTIQEELDQKATLAALNTALFRIADLEKKTAVFQSGGSMVFWRKPASQIPTGWAEVVDWRGRLPIGWNPDDSAFDQLGETGGQKTRNITAANLPANIPTDAIKLNASHSSFGIKTGTDTWVNPATVNNGGSGQALDIMNPYRVVMFIEFIG